MTNQRKTFFTSYTGFGRENIIQMRNRKYSDVLDMNHDIIEKWNDAVTDDDIVYHLGNFGIERTLINTTLSWLNGKIYIIPSNDDGELREVMTNGPEHANVTIIDHEIVTLPEYDVVISHYPLLDWPGKELGVLNLHGQSLWFDRHDFVEGRVNVGTDFWNYTPVELSQVRTFVEGVRGK